MKRFFDGDDSTADKSTVFMGEQLLKASQTNFSPQVIQVYVNGPVVTAGGVTLIQGSALDQAITSQAAHAGSRARSNSSASQARARRTGTF